MLTAILEIVIIRKEISAERTQTRRQMHQCQSFSPDGTLVEGSSFWLYIGVLATTYESVVAIMLIVTLDGSYTTLAMSSLPFVILLYVGNLGCQPRRKSSKFMWLLRLQFGSFIYINLAAIAFYNGTMLGSMSCLFLAAVLTVLFHFALKFRASVGRLPDEDLERFLVENFFKGGIQTVFPILFLLFRSVKCMYEKGDVTECDETSFCSTLISLYLICWWLTKLVQGSVRLAWQKELNLSIEKVAKMQDISLRRGVSGFCTLLTGVCGIFLFSMMSAEEMDNVMLTIIGVVGFLSCLGIVISKIYSSLRAQELMRALSSESGERDERNAETDEVDEPVEECSWVFVSVSFLLASVFSLLCVCYSVTLKNKYWIMAYIIYPIVSLSFVMAMVLKPKRRDPAYMRFLYFHFVTFALVSEISGAVGNFRSGSTFGGLFNLFRCFLYCVAFCLGLRLRESAAKVSAASRGANDDIKGVVSSLAAEPNPILTLAAPRFARIAASTPGAV